MITENRDLKCPHYFIYCEVIAIASFQSSSTVLNVTCSFFAFNPGRGGEETAGVCKFCRTRYAVRTHQPRFAKHFVRVVSRNSIHGQSKYIYIYIDSRACMSSSRFARMEETRSIEALMYKLQLSRFRSRLLSPIQLSTTPFTGTRFPL